VNVHEYRAGSWIAIVGDGALALLHPDIGAPAARDLWRLTRTGSRLGTWVEHLAGGGIRTLPSFAMVEAHPSGLSVLVRGDLSVQVGDERVSGAGYTTWREAVLPGADGFTITTAGTEVSTPDWLPVGGGIVLASALRSPAEQTGAAHDNHAGLHLAHEPEEEEDLEVTLMQAPALAAAIGRPAGPPTPAPVTGAPAGSDAAGSAEAPADDAPVPSETREPSETRAPSETRVPDEDAVPAASVPLGDAGDPEEIDPAEDAEYDHLFWSTEQLAADDAERQAVELGTASSVLPDAPATPGPSASRPTAAGPVTPSQGLEATQVPENEDDLFAPPVTDEVPGGAPVHAVQWDTPVPAPGPGLISEVPWARRVDEGDHDGHTVMPSQLPKLPAAATPDADGPVAQVPEDDPVLELVLSTGPRVEVTRPVLLGRAPESARFRGNAVPRLVTVANPERDISGTHVEIRPAGDHVVVTDMNSTNGTVLVLPGQPSFRLHPGTGVPVPPGGVIELGTGVSVTVVRTGEEPE
jgi:resuscitation-promoting factor RpfA